MDFVFSIDFLRSRTDQAPVGPWAQSGVRGPHGPSHPLNEIDLSFIFVYCLSYEPINFSFSLPYFLSSLSLFFNLNFVLFLVILGSIFQVRAPLGPPRPPKAPLGP